MTGNAHADIFQTSSQQASILQSAQPDLLLALLQVELTQTFSPQTLEPVLRELCERHEILRTRYVQAAGMKRLVQEIHPQAQLQVVRSDDLAQARTQVREGLAQYPLVASVYDRQLLVGVALASADEQSLVQLSQELQALLDGGALQPFDGLQYADYAAWQADLADEPIGIEGRAFWRELFAGQPATLPLPGQLRHRAAVVEAAEQRAVGFAAALGALSVDAARAEETLLGLWAAFIAGLDQQHSLLVGLDVDGRNEQLAQTLGHFARQLPVRLDLDLFGSFTAQWPALNRQIQLSRSWLDCLDESEAPLAYACGYRVAADDRQAHIELEHPPALKLYLQVQASGDDASLKLLSPARLFTAGQLQAWLEQFVHFVVQLAGEPTRPLQQALTVDAAQQARVLALYDRRGAVNPSIGGCLHEMFEQQARLHPQRIALQVGEHTEDYASLDQKANGLAHVLRERGVGADSVVAVYGERSVEIIVALLGILKAGGAYLPLDPLYPADRLSFMLHDAGVQALISLEPLAADIEVGAGIERLALENGLPAARTDGVTADGGQNLAYVIYTSGSTGKPKGVMVSHANACTSTQARAEFYKAPLQRFLMLSSFSFDSSVAGLFWTLGLGGTLYLPQEGQHKDPASIARVIGEQRISHFLALPSFYAQILEHLDSAAPACVIVAGEACPLELCHRHLALLPDTLLVNEYGPSEATVWCSAQTVENLPSGERVAIGGPIAQACLLALDEEGALAGFGRAAELFVGGPGLVRGYLNRPALTASRFLPDPFAQAPGQRLYRTGDRVVSSVEGALDYLGRLDFQIKIRGYRIELGEIENRLLQSAEVREAAVIARETAAGPQLVAFVVRRSAAASAAVIEATLLERLREQMPEYMVPSLLQVIDNMPLTPNGKLDRQALSALEVRTHEYVAPRNELEAVLAEIWQQALQLERVGVNDNFFALGGHSLLATRIRSEVQSRLNLDLPLRAFFEGETVALLAIQVEQHRQSSLGDDKVDALEALFDTVEDV
ncbi:pyoverdine sidechain peptide synthetase [Pseudomonas sp. StFLB209]|uniref:non-ribosomal peptide synthetase n=1 Tax=Pseudomonas sp. StFLB209 TaxID=1028989 RepID=UPI0004F926A6|nr:non-ribosomal peptide synthetase [Pseudomonas sp. StFLB209]BAP43370.1 pyoverdine sidechain peptide synthetase [Pseudomonas sp. StFLB209]